MRTTTPMDCLEKTVPPPQLLVSIRNLAELEISFAASSPWIDVKEPAHGPLGRPDKDIAMGIYQRLGMLAGGTLRAQRWAWKTKDSGRGELPHVLCSSEMCHPEEQMVRIGGTSDQPEFSIALGELRQTTEQELREYCEGFGPDVHWKIGLAGEELGSGWQGRVESIASTIATPRQWILAHYGDAEKASAPTWDEILQVSKTIGSEFILVDTWEKNGKSLLDILKLDTLKHMAGHARAMGLQIAIAGALRTEQLPLLREINPYWIGFRSELCESRRRDAPLNQQQLERMLNLFQSYQPLPGMVPQHVVR